MQHVSVATITCSMPKDVLMANQVSASADLEARAWVGTRTSLGHVSFRFERMAIFLPTFDRSLA